VSSIADNRRVEPWLPLGCGQPGRASLDAEIVSLGTTPRTCAGRLERGLMDVDLAKRRVSSVRASTFRRSAQSERQG
jgi:hypothetical protein